MKAICMSKLEYTVEDFVLDPDFRRWVLSPDKATKTYWEAYLGKNPSKYQDIDQARKLVLNMARKSHTVSENRIEAAWKNIDKATGDMEAEIFGPEIIPLNSLSTLKKQEREYRVYSQNHQFYRIA